MGLINTADLDARKVEYVDTAQAQAAIDDASAVARACVAPVLDTVDRGETPDTPAAVIAVVVNMVRRALSNPRGLAQETLGDYSFAAGSNAVATLLPTAREKKMLRAAAAAFAKANPTLFPDGFPAFGVSGVYQQVDLPGQPTNTEKLADTGW